MTRPVLPLVSAFFLIAASAHAASGTWSSTVSGGLWSNGANWSGGTVADGSGFTADFATIDIPADTTVAMDASHTLSTLKFGDTATGTAGSWVLSNNGNAANILTLDGTANVTVGTLGTNKTATISAVVAGTAGITADGTGTLVLSGNNTYTGTTWAKSAAGTSTGTIQFSSAANLGLDTSAIKVGAAGASSGVLRYTGAGEIFARGIDVNGHATLDASGAGNWNISGNVGVSGGNAQSLTLTGTGVGTISGNLSQNGSNASPLLKTGTGSWTVSGANNFTGAISIRGSSTLGVSGTSFLQLSTLGNGGNLTLGQNGNSVGQLNYAGAGESTNRLISLDGHGTIVNNGAGALNFTNTASILHGTGSHTLTLAGSNTGANTIASAIVNGSGTSVLSKTGAGTWALAGANTYTGGTTVSAGTLVTGSVSALGSGAVNVSALATLQIGNGTFNNVTLASGANLVVASTGIIKLGGFNAGSFDTASGAIVLAGGGTYNFSGASLNLNGAINGLAAGAHTYTLISGGSLAGGGADLSLGNITGFDATVSNLSYSAGVLSFTAVPEPSTYGLLGAGVLAGIALVRRRRRA